VLAVLAAAGLVELVCQAFLGQMVLLIPEAVAGAAVQALQAHLVVQA
jgi:hypothetical protein